jgi:trans-aconitate 2-methyltransferase
MKVREEVVNFYNNFAKKQGVNKRHYFILMHLINSGLKINHSVLEMGCGIGSLTGLLAKYLKNGHLLSIDLSPESINIAKENLSKFKNLNLVAHDITSYEFGKTLFDAIVLPDVLEHIPLELHFNLFEKMSKILKPDGFVFINIPNPEYLEWCIENRPDLLQIIDQPIYTSELVINTYPHGFYINELKTYSIWVKDGDYQYIVLRKSKQQDFTITIEDKPNLIDKIKYKINEK